MSRVRTLLVTAVMLVVSGLMYPPPGLSSDACASAEIRSGRDQALQGRGPWGWAVQDHFHRRVVYCPGCLLRRVAEQPGFPSTKPVR
jgi:hypothetical protein